MAWIYSFEQFKEQHEFEHERNREGKSPTKNQKILKKVQKLCEEQSKLPPTEGIDLDR